MLGPMQDSSAAD